MIAKRIDRGMRTQKRTAMMPPRTRSPADGLREPAGRDYLEHLNVLSRAS
jgi:hypothetical protein